jgi:hypothetical protein
VIKIQGIWTDKHRQFEFSQKKNAKISVDAVSMQMWKKKSTRL